MITNYLSDNGLVILLFHGVIKNSKYKVRNYIRKHIQEDYFYQTLKSLKKYGKCLSMNEIIYHKIEKIPFQPNSFAITFDDGFENNYTVAAPILDELNLPATFYITTDFVQNNTMSWTDQIEFGLETIDNNCKKVVTPWNSQKINISNIEEKIFFMKSLRSQVFEENFGDTEKIVDWFFDTIKMEKIINSDDQLDKKLSWSQLIKMSENNLFDIGGHTHTHRILSYLKPKEIDFEIKHCLKLLSEKANINTKHFAYPQGQANHYNFKVINNLKKSGIIICPTAINGVNSLDIDLIELKRNMVT